MDQIRSAIESVFRQESGKIIAGLIRISGSFDRAEEAMQESFASALVSWPQRGIPDNPAAWIMAAAHRKLIDDARRDRTRREKMPALKYEAEIASTEPNAESLTMESSDDRLRLIFTCCHPAINREAQIALTLRTLGGLSTPEIAKAFLISETTLSQRLVRAKRKIEEAHIPFEIPSQDRLPERLAAVQSVIYLIFNEGYAASSGTDLVRRDLCAEAIRLGRVLCELMPRDSENLGLLALMLIHDSRRNARVVRGELVTLEEQDRSLWDQTEIAEGLGLVERALRLGHAGSYLLQAAIASLHAQASFSAETDWPQIAALYNELFERNPSPVIALNRAVAVAMSGRLEEGLREIDGLGDFGLLDRYYLFHAARADLLRRMNRRTEAVDAYRRAINLATNPIELTFLERRCAFTQAT